MDKSPNCRAQEVLPHEKTDMDPDAGLALMLTGCGQKPSAPPEETPRQGQEEPVQEEGQQTPADQAVYEDAQISDQIHYPQLTQFQGELLLDYVNQSLPARPRSWRARRRLWSIR